MAFERRHYVKIAAALAEMDPDQRGPAVKALAAMFARDNGRFNRSRFDDACNPEPVKRKPMAEVDACVARALEVIG